MQRWLERIPFLEQGGYQFWQSYKQAADLMLGRDKAAIQANPLLNDEVLCVCVCVCICVMCVVCVIASYRCSWGKRFVCARARLFVRVYRLGVCVCGCVRLRLGFQQRATELKNHEANEASFRTIWDADEHAKLVAQGALFTHILTTHIRTHTLLHHTSKHMHAREPLPLHSLMHPHTHTPLTTPYTIEVRVPRTRTHPNTF